MYTLIYPYNSFLKKAQGCLQLFTESDRQYNMIFPVVKSCRFLRRRICASDSIFQKIFYRDILYNIV